MYFTSSRAFVILAVLGPACTETNPFGLPSDGSTSSSGPHSMTSTADVGTTTTATPPEETTTDESSESYSTGPATSAADTSSESGNAETTANTESSSSSGPAVICEQDGVVGEGEVCDDDNPFPGDGCTGCQIDEGWGCYDEPSRCSVLCDPILQDCEGAGDGCYPTNEGEYWSCATDASGEQGEFGDTCEFINVCDVGLACVDPDFFETCSGVNGCCSPVCALDDPSCPIRWTCTSYYEGAPPAGYENVGVCRWL